MGLVRIETFNTQLMNISDYRNPKLMKKLYKNFSNLESLAQAGDTVAACIYIDLKTALSPESGVLTKLQRKCITDYFLHNYTLIELSEMYNRDETTILDHINIGIKRICKALSDTNIYQKE